MARECREYGNRFGDLLSERLRPDEEAELREHLACCGDCRERLASMAQGGAELDPEESRELTAGILARTSGSACESAHEMIGHGVGGDLSNPDDELLQSHLDHCAGCEALAAAVAWSGALLPAMAELEPDRDFLGDVLSATSRLESAETASTALDGLRKRWQRMWQRPRFALELAYVGTMLLILLFALPFSPARNAPNRALDAIGEGTNTFSASLTPNLGVMHESLVRQGSRIREWSDTHLVPEIREIGAELDERGRLISTASVELRRDSGIVIDAALQRDLGESVAGLSAIGDDLAKIWHGILGMDPAATEEKTETGSTRA